MVATKGRLVCRQLASLAVTVASLPSLKEECSSGYGMTSTLLDLG